MVRRLLAVVVGIVLGVVLIGISQAIFHAVSPPSSELDFSNPDAMATYVASLPVWKLLIIIVTYAIGAYGGGYIGAKVTDTQPDLVGLVIGIGLTVFSLLNLLQIPHPIWFWILALVIHVPCALWGTKSGGK